MRHTRHESKLRRLRWPQRVDWLVVVLPLRRLSAPASACLWGKRAMTAEETFRATLRQSGLEYDGPIIVDGKLKRFKADGDRDKNSWYVLFPGPPVAGAYGCWKRGIERQTWCEKSGSSLSSLEKELIRHRWQEAKAKLEAETVRRQAKARKLAAWI